MPELYMIWEWEYMTSKCFKHLPLLRELSTSIWIIYELKFFIALVFTTSLFSQFSMHQQQPVIGATPHHQHVILLQPHQFIERLRMESLPTPTPISPLLTLPLFTTPYRHLTPAICWHHLFGNGEGRGRGPSMDWKTLPSACRIPGLTSIAVGLNIFIG